MASGAILPAARTLLPAVGVRRLQDTGEAAAVPVYHGVSYCDAVRLAGDGQALRLLPGSIEVCRWAPVVLGLKPPEDAFEQGLSPRLPYRPAGLLLAPLDAFPGAPEVVILRATPAALRARLALAGPSDLWQNPSSLSESVRSNGFSRAFFGRRRNATEVATTNKNRSLLRQPASGQLDRSALPVLYGSGSQARRGLIGAVNRALAALAPWGAWQRLTQRLFRYQAVTAGFEALISRALADMSICRNSTAIPLLSGRANVSFFCTGAITWGLNPATHLTSGWPLPIYQSTNLPTYLPKQSKP